MSIAIAFVLAQSFQTIITSFVVDLLSPIISLASNNTGQLPNKFIFLSKGKCSEINVCNTPLIAGVSGAITWNWGNFFQTIINFLLIGISLFFILKIYIGIIRLGKPIQINEYPCKYCLIKIPTNAKKCGFCTSDLNDIELVD